MVKGAHSLAAAFGCGNVGYELQSVGIAADAFKDNCKRGSHIDARYISDNRIPDGIRLYQISCYPGPSLY